MSADAMIDLDRGVISRLRDWLRGLSDDELAAMTRQSPAVHLASCVRIQNKDNEPIQPAPNILQLRMSEVYEVLRGLHGDRRAVPDGGLQAAAGGVFDVRCAHRRNHPEIIPQAAPGFVSDGPVAAQAT